MIEKKKPVSHPKFYLEIEESAKADIRKTRTNIYLYRY